MQYNLLLKQSELLSDLFHNGDCTALTQFIFLEQFPPQWASALLLSLRSTFPGHQLVQCNLSSDGVYFLRQVTSKAPQNPILVLLDGLNGSGGSESAVHFKDMVYSHPHHHFVVMTSYPVYRWMLPNHLGEIRFLSTQEALLQRINATYPELTEEKQTLMNSVSQSDSDLLNFAEKIIPKYRTEDLILSQSMHRRFLEILNAAKHKLQGRYLSIWKSKHSRGHGVILLFYGKSGTGKTMAAEVIAHSLGYPLYRVNYSKIQSKYIGETEKNLESIFKAAQGVKGILLFDEGDSLFAKRTETLSSNDRYANQEVGYLLQAIEQYEGIVIISTNHDQELDPAFLRRFTRTLRFGVSPQKEVVHQLWRSILPHEVPLEGDFDFDLLAAQPLTGGDIRNVLMNAFLAAESRPDPALTMIDLLWFSRIECQKKGVEFRENSLPDELKELVGSEWESKIIEANADPLQVKHVWNSKEGTVSPESLFLRHRKDRIATLRMIRARQKQLDSQLVQDGSHSRAN
jgi:DNA polymerase III delta prime subunit